MKKHDRELTRIGHTAPRAYLPAARDHSSVRTECRLKEPGRAKLVYDSGGATCDKPRALLHEPHEAAQDAAVA